MLDEGEESTARRPHHVHPARTSVRVILAIKNFAAIPGVCHIGLGVTALNTQRVLRRHGIHCEAWSTQTAKELRQRIHQDVAGHPARPITHVIVSAPSWVQPGDFAHFSQRWPDIEFVQLNHSGTAYLSIDKFGIRNIREVLDLEQALHNVRVAGNNRRFVKWAHGAFGLEVAYLPNLYDTATFVHPLVTRRDHDPLRIGSFGAGRPWKNQLTAAESAVQLGRRLGVPIEFYVNTQRPDGGERMIEARKELFDHLPYAKLIEVPWQLWPKFRHTVRMMDVMLSPSFDETFCVVVADGIAEGCPSVVTPAMEWTPHGWQCEPWDPSSVTRTALSLLHDRIGAVHDARQTLERFVREGVNLWVRYLTRNAEWV